MDTRVSLNAPNPLPHKFRLQLFFLQAPRPIGRAGFEMGRESKWPPSATRLLRQDVTGGVPRA